MSLAQVLEQYMSGLPNLSANLKKNLAEIHRLDSECQKKNTENQRKIHNTIKNWKNIPKESRAKAYHDIKAQFNDMRNLSEDKIKLASQTYELVDRYIIRLDNDTAKFQASIRQKFADAAAQLQEGSQEVEVTNSRKRKSGIARKDNKKPNDRKSEHAPIPDFQNFVDTAPLVDMPVDPNEPTYCICHQVSFGQMVCCDNKSCPIEWFHFQCVGLTSKPRGKWFCPRCTEKFRRKKSLSDK
uniref:Inhibitor of growth protein n=1 Tax=Acrobeloides nanus TaxID=290746 RepID=A0A914CBB9_9BILA